MSKPFSDPRKVMPARAILADCAIALGSDFHTLGSDQVDRLLDHAKLNGYRKPKHANGSRARYYHDMLQRKAGGITERDIRKAIQPRPSR